MFLFNNNAKTFLAEVLANSSGATAMVVENDGTADTFFDFASGAEKSQLATLTHSSLPGLYEVVRIVQRVYGTDEFTVQRAYEGVMQEWPIGTTVEARITAKMLESVLQCDSKGVIRKGDGYGGGDYDGAFIFDAASTEAYNSTAGVSPNLAASGNRQFVFRGRSRVAGAIQLSGYPTLQIIPAVPTEGYAPSTQDLNMSYISVGGTHPVDLGVTPAWTSGLKLRGTVVVPTVPDGFQYWIDPNDWSSSFEVTQPTWQGSADRTPAASGFWVPTELPIDFTQDTGRALVITEVGFIAHKADVTTVPYVSIGTSDDATRFANNVPLSQITYHGEVHRIPIATGGAPAYNLKFKLETAATGGKFLGRFYWHGFFVEVDSNL